MVRITYIKCKEMGDKAVDIKEAVEENI